MITLSASHQCICRFLTLVTVSWQLLNFCATDVMCAATNCCDSDSQAVTIDLNQQNLTDFISNSLSSNVNPCDYFELTRLNNSIKKDSCHLFLHLNISSLQAHFDDLFDFLSRLDQPPVLCLFRKPV